MVEQRLLYQEPAMSEKPTVSVVMNTYQEKPQYLNEAILSYINQRNVNVTLIISTVEGDPSIEYVRTKFPDNDKIKLCISTKKEHPGKGVQGIYYQLNKAMALVDGEWFSYASSNDVAVITKCEMEIACCLKAKKQVCYSSYAKTNAQLKNMRPINFHPFNYLKLLKGNFISDCSLIKTELLRKHLPFDARYYNCGFWHLWLKIYNEEGNVFTYNNGIAFLYRVTPESTHVQREKERKKKLTYSQARLNMRREILANYPLFRRAIVKSTKYPQLNGLYQLHCTSTPIYKKGNTNLVLYKNGTWKIVQNRKVLATNKNQGIGINWQFRVTSPP